MLDSATCDCRLLLVVFVSNKRLCSFDSCHSTPVTLDSVIIRMWPACACQWQALSGHACTCGCACICDVSDTKWSHILVCISHTHTYIHGHTHTHTHIQNNIFIKVCAGKQTHTHTRTSTCWMVGRICQVQKPYGLRPID